MTIGELREFRDNRINVINWPICLAEITEEDEVKKYSSYEDIIHEQS